MKSYCEPNSHLIETKIESSRIFHLGKTYDFELVIVDEDHMEFKGTNNSTKGEFSKKYTLCQLRQMSPLLFFSANIHEVYQKFLKKINENKCKVTDNESSRHIHLNVSYNIDGEEKSSAFKLLKIKDRPFEVNDIEGLTIKPIEKHQVALLL